MKGIEKWFVKEIIRSSSRDKKLLSARRFHFSFRTLERIRVEISNSYTTYFARRERLERK